MIPTTDEPERSCSEHDRDPQHQSLSSLAEVRAFLDGAAEVAFSAPPSADRHAWLATTLRQFHYGSLKRPDKGLVRAFALKVTGYSRAQLTRLIRQWQQDRCLTDRRGPPTQPFARRYTEADVRALVTLDRLHGQLSGPATRKLAERAFNVFDDAAYERLATISVGHLELSPLSWTSTRRDNDSQGDVQRPHASVTPRPSNLKPFDCLNRRIDLLPSSPESWTCVVTRSTSGSANSATKAKIALFVVQVAMPPSASNQN